MASPAGAAPFRFVYVDVMQIHFAIAELGESGRFPIRQNALFVALEAKTVKLWLVSRVELRGIFLDEQAEIVAPMRLVTGAAILGVDWSVLDRVVGQQVLEVCQLLPLPIF